MHVTRSAAAPLLRSLAVSARYSYHAGPSTVTLAWGSYSARRALSTKPVPPAALENNLKPGDLKSEEAFIGSEGLHYADSSTKVAKENAEVTGDWVLFHPVYKNNEVKAVLPSTHRDTLQFSDKMANSLVRLSRWGFDFVTGYQHKEIPAGSNMSLEELRKKGYINTEGTWMHRILFLETIAGIPGMVAAMIRHLQSLRIMRRDGGWIHTLLEEAENERMHLMTFMTMKQPSIFFRAMILGAQGVFFNLFFISYLMSPRICHRFVGYLEEEAVKTYTSCIQDIENGRFPEWENKPAPQIAKDYWRLGPNATVLDLIYAVRSDETTHRFVNHSLANLEKGDVNPFAFREPDMTVKGVKYGFEREEATAYVQESRKLLQEQEKPHSS